ncbi:E1A-binding protein p400 isoform X3 [Rhinatrema bivittatum]|uniref:E1A-binding protein p400 isoform X3 n=1 Tax=Rhinatrema bivittatum TaxID=194408 RepID=UPI00112BC20B|nr:E1A-binding protein p400 isoform X3 [Rhinatrema bivittatum]
MHHGSGPQNSQHQLQRSRSFTGNEGEEQQPQASLPQSPAAQFAPSASPSGPQSPSYQIQQLIMSRNPVAGQNLNITLQNVGQVVAGNQQITLTPLPIPSPASPGFQFSSQQRRFEHGSPSYIQVTSPLPQQIQAPNSTQPSPVPVQTLQNVRSGTAATGLGICSQSPTRGFVDANVLVRQISLSPSNGGHFVFQDGSGIAQIAQGTQVQIQTGTSANVRERRLSQPHSQTGGTIHHLGPQSPVASGANMQPLTSPSHITTTNLPPQISSIIQGQLIQQQQQVLHGQQLSRPMGFDRSSGGMVAAVGGTSGFGLTSPPTPTSPSRATGPHGLSNLPLTPSVSTTVKKTPKKLEEIPPASQEDAQMRKQCLENYHKHMKVLKDTFKEYLVELFFLQHFQGNMMDFLAFKKKHCVLLQAFVRQHFMDLEEEEDEEEEEQSEVINDEQQAHAVSPAAGTANAIEIEALKRQAATQAGSDAAKRPRLDMGRHGMVFQHSGVASGVSLQQLMPTVQGGMPPTPQTGQLTGQKQSQQQYDPTKGPPVQNAASLHTPPPQLPGRLQPTSITITSVPAALQVTQQQQAAESPTQPQLPIHVKTQQQSLPIPTSPQAQLPMSLQQPALHASLQGKMQMQRPQVQPSTQQQNVAVRPLADTGKAPQRPTSTPQSASTANPSGCTPPPPPPPSQLSPVKRTSPGTSKSLSPVSSRSAAGVVAPKAQSSVQSAPVLPQECPQNKLTEQENQVHQRIAELRKEGLWSLRRLPKLQEASRPKSHWDYLLEEMQWMATDFAQERRWKMASAKKLIRTAVRHCEEKKTSEERAEKEEQSKLRRIAASAAREIEYFWCNIEQVVEIKLQVELQEKRKKVLRSQSLSKEGQDTKANETIKPESNEESPTSEKKCTSSSSVPDEEVEDDEETIDEQETREGNIDHELELLDLAKEADLPLDVLKKQYEGAYSENFHWPQPMSDSEEEPSDQETDGSPMENAPKQVVLIDSLLCIDQQKDVERTGTGQGTAKKHARDIAEVAAAAELLLPRGSARISAAGKLGVPSLLHGALREYQQIGLDWLAKQYKKNLNGILADETGLGKNVQVIALLAHLACNEGNWGPHLVVVRSCRMLKWELEFKRWCPGLKVLLHFDIKKEFKRRQVWTEPNNFNICITSYKQLFKSHQAFLKMRWKYLVLDEVQQIRSMSRKHWEALFSIQSQRRLLLRDTPLQNTLMELWTMVHFLIPGISRTYLDFPVKANSDENQDYCHKVVIRLHRFPNCIWTFPSVYYPQKKQMTQPFILRRSKRDVERQLTKKYEHVLKCRLSNRQKTLYEDVVLQPGTQEALKSGHFVSVLHILMQLQRICNHPDLEDPRPSRSPYVAKALQYNTASLVLTALESDPWKSSDMSMFDLIGLENKVSRYEAQALPKLKVTKKLIYEISSSPDPPPRPTPVKIKPNRLFQPVQYGQKPEGKTVVFPSTTAQRTVTTTTASVAPQGQVRGRLPIATASANSASATPFQTSQASSGVPRQQSAATFATAANTANPVKQPGQSSTPASQLGSAQPPAPSHTNQQSVLPQRLVLTSQAQARLPSGEVVKIAQLASIAGAQGRVAQPETPVTLQFQGNKFTLSQSQLRQLTAGQPLQLQGNVLQIVSAPGQQYLRPQGAIAMPQTGTIPNAINAPGNQQLPGSAAVTQLGGIAGRATLASSASGDQGALSKLAPAAGVSTQESVEEKSRLLKERLERIFTGNERRCSRAPVYGRDLLATCSLTCRRGTPPQGSIKGNTWGWAGFVNCQLPSGALGSLQCSLQRLIRSPEQQEDSLQHVVKRVICVVPPAVAAPPCLYVANPPPSYTCRRKIMKQKLAQQWAPCLQWLRQQSMPLLLQFPDLRLVQCDSGKLEALAVLLQKLKSEGRRVLIFSQMLLMMDILEMFLNFQSFTYIRIDENANHEQCQELMKSFNQDGRIFCAILSTHSRSMGVGLVEADTVVFYDNDINPVMDTKAQEWCDRIGRSKDIHIYRLVSGNSIEEKLLKNGTKDLIREVAAQGNDYSMAFLTQQTIQELFEVSSPLDDSGFRVKAEEFVVLSQEPSPADTITPKVAKPFIEALKSISHEEEGAKDRAQEPGTALNSDVPAAEISDLGSNEEPTQLEELADLMNQLTPIEKYALHYLELFHVSGDREKQNLIEEDLKAAKREWEMKHLKELKEREKQRFLEEEERAEELLTYTREDAYNMEYIYEDTDGQTEIMPLWTPPTPPQDDNDIYIDSVMCLMYDTTPVPESKLPPVYVRKERKRHKMDPAGRKKKQRHGETVIPPRSLFDRAVPGLLKMRRESKEQKKNILLKQQAQFAKPLPALVKPPTEAGPDNPEWLISEDWALLQAVKQLLELPLNLSIISPAHTPNWDLVSDVVNSCSRIYRSSKQCRNRYESVIIPREEGKLIYEASPKKKSKNIYKSKSSRALRTGQIYVQDEGVTHTQLYTSRFELMKMTAGKRSPPLKPLLGMNPFQKNPKHASVLAESGISYDKPLPPIQVASLRAERIAKEKKALVEQVRAQQQPVPPLQQNGGPQAQQAIPQQSQPQPPAQPQATQQPQAKVQAAVTTVASTALLAGTIKTAVTGTSITTATVSGNVIVNTVAGVPSATFQPINKRLVSPVVTGTVTTSGGTAAQVVHTQQRTVAVSAAPAEVVTIATNQSVRAVTPVTASAVVSTSLTPAQARSLVTQGTAATTTSVQLTGKSITPAHFQLLRQQQATQVQVPQLQAQTQAQIKTVGKLSQEQLLKLQKQKLQLPQQQAGQPGAQQNAPVTVQQQAQQSPQITTVTTARPGAVLTGTTVANLQVARLVRHKLQAQGQIQGQTAQTAQVALAKPPVVSVPAAVVSSAGVTTLPVTVAGISVAIGQPQKAGGQTMVAQPLHVQPLLKLKQHHAVQQQQKSIQPQATAAQAAVQQKPYFSLQITTQQASAQAGQQKVTYTTQPALKTQFLTTSLAQAQKAAGTQQVQAQIQVTKLPQGIQQQATVASIQQVVSASQQVQPQTVTFSQATAAGQQVQVIPAGSAATQVVQQKLLQQQVVTTAAPQIQASALQSSVQAAAGLETPNQQAKVQARTPAVRMKAPTKPS